MHFLAAESLREVSDLMSRVVRFSFLCLIGSRESDRVLSIWGLSTVLVEVVVIGALAYHT